MLRALARDPVQLNAKTKTKTEKKTNQQNHHRSQNARTKRNETAAFAITPFATERRKTSRTEFNSYHT